MLISKCNRVIFILDCLEDIIPLYVPEANFRKIVKVHLEKLLFWQHLYWKKRCTQRYVKVGEENSKFFQAMASERHRRNYIASLQLADGTPCSTHDLLANAFWSAFKNRMGVEHGVPS